MTRADHLDPDNNHWHWIAADLRLWRRMRNLKQSEVAQLLGVDNSTVSNYESGSAKLPEGHAKTLDYEWSTGGHFLRHRRLAESKHDPDWFAQYTSYERKSHEISAYSALVVHALLQTEDYARALIAGAQMVDDVERVLAERMARQEILDQEHTLGLWLLIKQSVLEDPIGGPEVMRAQLAHLLEMSHNKNMVVRLVPREAGAHPGIDGSFTLLNTPRGVMAWSAAVGGGRLVSDPAEVRDYRLRYDLIGADALSRDASRSLIVQIMETMK